MEQRTWTALGCRVDVLVTEADALVPAVRAVEGVLDAVDLACSRFRPDSELSRLNASPLRSVRVGDLLGSAVAAGLRAGRLTDGAVDLTVGQAIRRIGYDADFPDLSDCGPIELVIESVPGWRTVSYEPVGRTVTRPVGVEIDLGSVGKALAADLAASAAAGAAPSGGMLVSLGGDIATAGRAPNGGWRISIAEDSRAALEDADETIGIHSGAVATSSTTVRRWTRAGTALHHLIDPSTGLPTAGTWRTATVVAASCVDANIAATAAIVLGAGAVEWLRHTGLPARLVSASGSVERVGAWPLPVAA